MLDPTYDRAVIFSIFDSGNLVVSYDKQDEAVEALAELAEDREAAPQLLIAFDDNRPVADCIPGERLVIPVRAA